MLAVLEHMDSTYVVEILVWSIPALFALWLGARCSPGTRVGWLMVGLCTAGFAMDKAFDVHASIYSLGRELVHSLDPETHLRGEKIFLRAGLLGGIFAIVIATGVFILRLGRQRTGSKLVSLSGVALIFAYLCLRLMPETGAFLDSTRAGWGVEALAWSLVIGGDLATLLGQRGPTST